MNVNVKECQGVQYVQLMSPSVWMSRVRKSEAKWGLIGGSEGRRRRTRPGVHRHLIGTNNEMIGTNNAIIGTYIKMFMGVGGAFCLVCVWPQIMKTCGLHQKQVIFCQLLESSFLYAGALSQKGQQGIKRYKASRKGHEKCIFETLQNEMSSALNIRESKRDKMFTFVYGRTCPLIGTNRKILWYIPLKFPF